MVSSNTIIASLSHSTPKSMFGQKLLAIWVLDKFQSVWHYKNQICCSPTQEYPRL